MTDVLFSIFINLFLDILNLLGEATLVVMHAELLNSHSPTLKATLFSFLNLRIDVGDFEMIFLFFPSKSSVSFGGKSNVSKQRKLSLRGKLQKELS